MSDIFKARREASRRWLRYVAQAQDAKKRLEDELACFDEMAGLKGTDYEAIRVSGSTSPDGLHNIVLRKEALAERHRAAIVECVERFAQASEAIEQLDEEIHKEVLSYRYLQGFSIGEVADVVGFSYRWTTKLEADALEALYPFIPLYAK